MHHKGAETLIGYKTDLIKIFVLTHSPKCHNLFLSSHVYNYVTGQITFR